MSGKSGISFAGKRHPSRYCLLLAAFAGSIHYCLKNFLLMVMHSFTPVCIISEIQAYQLCFETEERARSLLHNVSSLLKPGGYFFGITPDSSTIWYGTKENFSLNLSFIF